MSSPTRNASKALLRVQGRFTQTRRQPSPMHIRIQLPFRGGKRWSMDARGGRSRQNEYLDQMLFASISVVLRLLSGSEIAAHQTNIRPSSKHPNVPFQLPLRGGQISTLNTHIYLYLPNHISARRLHGEASKQLVCMYVCPEICICTNQQPRVSCQGGKS